MVKITYKATQQDINMPVDLNLQKRIIKYACWGLGVFTFWAALAINFLFWLFR
jgi:hypothetical protein